MNKLYNISKATVEFTFLMLVDGPDKKMKQCPSGRDRDLDEG